MKRTEPETSVRKIQITGQNAKETLGIENKS
jgi:hypothetical protein